LEEEQITIGESSHDAEGGRPGHRRPAGRRRDTRKL